MQSWFADLWEAAKSGGPFSTMLLFLILYLVNQERKEVQKRCDELQRELLERTINGLNNAANSINNIGQIFSRVREVRERRDRERDEG